MAASETALANQALLKTGQAPIDYIDGTNVQEEKVNLIFDETRDATIIDGPEDGWEFAKHTYHGIDRESFTITKFEAAAAPYAATRTKVTATHTLIAGNKVEITGTTHYDGTYVVEDVSTTVSFTITKAYTSDDATGTAYWTSDDYAYRFARPTCLSVLRVKVGGLDLTDWRELGGFVLTNLESSEVAMDIIKVVTDVTVFPSYFTELLVVNLAINLHYNLTQDLRAIQLLESERQLKKHKAFAMDERRKYVKEKSTAWVNIGHTTETIE